MRHGESTSIRYFVAVHSAKGGVGKSTVAANLAVSLSQRGVRVALLDADVHGPSMGLMMGDDQRPETGPNEDFVYPREKHGVRFLSMANLVTANTPLIWRGAMVHNMLNQFLNGVLWGERDLMLIDMPPGTGDAQLSLAQAVPLTGAIVVTTPQELSLVDSVRGLNAFRQLNVPILGLIENMSGFVCDGCGDRQPLFGEDGGEIMAEEFEMPWLGRVPVDPLACVAGDTGTPVVLAHPDSVAATAFGSISDRLVQRLETSGAAVMFHLEWRVMGWTERQAEPQQAEPSDIDIQAVWQVSNDELGIQWRDGTVSIYGTRALRLACPCAACIDEWTGVKRLDEDSVDMSVQIAHVTSVGRYALAIEFTDGHKTGIYHFDRLRSLKSGEPIGGNE